MFSSFVAGFSAVQSTFAAAKGPSAVSSPGARRSVSTFSRKRPWARARRPLKSAEHSCSSLKKSTSARRAKTREPPRAQKRRPRPSDPTHNDGAPLVPLALRARRAQERRAFDFYSNAVNAHGATAIGLVFAPVCAIDLVRRRAWPVARGALPESWSQSA